MKIDRETEPTTLVHRLRQQHGDALPSAIAAARDIPVRYESWRVADDRVIYFGECWFDPPRIVLNARAIAREAARTGEDSATIAETVIAHELYHLLTRQPSSGAVERQAHEFARELMMRCSGLVARP
ncbi:MAG: hypothetical protein SF339_08375 [Blastocatellia bacterium]|nr:hypothetical protein [Blastocatellia bacterium]